MPRQISPLQPIFDRTIDPYINTLNQQIRGDDQYAQDLAARTGAAIDSNVANTGTLGGLRHNIARDTAVADSLERSRQGALGNLTNIYSNLPNQQENSTLENVLGTLTALGGAGLLAPDVLGKLGQLLPGGAKGTPRPGGGTNISTGPIGGGSGNTGPGQSVGAAGGFFGGETPPPIFAPDANTPSAVYHWPGYDDFAVGTGAFGDVTEPNWDYSNNVFDDWTADYANTYNLDNFDFGNYNWDAYSSPSWSTGFEDFGSSYTPYSSSTYDYYANDPYAGLFTGGGYGGGNAFGGLGGAT